MDEQDEEVHYLRVLHPTVVLPPPAPLHSKRHVVLDVDKLAVSSSLLRKIEQEIKHNECDPRVVFHSCRGLKRGSLEFEEAYIDARIRSSIKQQRVVRDPHLSSEFNMKDEFPHFFQHTNDGKDTMACHPMAVNHLGHLMSHFGLWVLILLGLQFLAAWRLSEFADVYLEGGRFFYLAVALIFTLAIDSAIWFRRRGNLCHVFLVPGAILYTMAILPVIIFHVRATILAMH